MFLEALLATALAGGWETHGPDFLVAGSTVAVAGGDDRRLYVLAGRAVFRSDDAAETWQKVFDAPSADYFVDLAAHPRDPDRVFACSVLAGFPPFTSFLYRSVDGGATWVRELAALDATDATSCSVAIEGDVVFAVLGTILFRSGDGGETFAAQRTPFDGATLQVAPDGSLLALTAGVVYQSRDSGMSWYVVYSPPVQCAIVALAIDPGEGERMFVGDLCGVVLRSRDGGLTWSTAAGVGGSISDLRIDPAHPSLIYASTAMTDPSPTQGRVLVSSDDAQSWRDLRLPLFHGAANLALSEDGSRLYAATSVGVFVKGLHHISTIPARP
jgi:photosystem II stability/assembly factor-like uncharacterized protein